MAKLKYTEFKNVYESDGTSKEEAEIKLMKANLMLVIREYMRKHDLTHEEASKIMGIDRARVSLAVKGHVDKFTLDYLLMMLMKIGYHCSFKLKLEAA